MKKLLSIIGVVGLVASSGSTVLACGAKPVNEGEGSGLQDLIAKFNAKIAQVITEHFSDRTEKFNIEAKDGSNHPFSRTKLMANGINKDAEESNYPEIDEEQLGAISQNLSTILETNDLAASINDISSKSNEFDILTNNGPIVSKIEFDKSSIKINYTRSITESEDNPVSLFLADLNASLKISYKYNGINSELVSKEFTPNLTLLISDSDNIIDQINEIYTEIQESYNKDEELTWWKHSTLYEPVVEKYKMFEMYSDVTRIWRLQAHYQENTRFNEALNSILVNLDGTFKDSTFSLDEVEVLSETLNSKVSTGESVIETYETETGGTHPLHKPLFSELLIDGQSHNFVDPDESRQVNDSIFNLLNVEAKDQINSYHENLKDYYAEKPNFDVQDEEMKSLLDRDNFMNGSVALQNIKLNVTENYSVKLNTINMEWVLAVSGETWNNEPINESHIGEAMYWNTEWGIQRFQFIWGLQERKGSVIQ
ncbi:hypothetical protein SCLARK_0015 [Spiroplasma clarkii]|uniref:Lipoprotein n=1 Tax=Spiroplasma clarkii TaxID=2139 RepID=A0A1Y0KZ67_9MOLU|nr:lipoprotein [Spiroplasma clarkii]ARU90850.1 hypothetical protein SCLARK_0015 [Spiroplasma clarkii]ATX71637.1 hypothetical protein SCLAR_v1c13390 [Spiroplasma clarkii]